MKKIAGAMTALVIGFTGVVVSTAPAVAGVHDPCVTNREYRVVESGWKLGRVQDKFDSNGKNMYQGYGYQYREWRHCNGKEIISVSFEWKGDRWSMQSKSRYNPDAAGE